MNPPWIAIWRRVGPGVRPEVDAARSRAAALGFFALQHYTSKLGLSCGVGAGRPKRKFWSGDGNPNWVVGFHLVRPAKSPIDAGLLPAFPRGCCGLPRGRNRRRMSPQQTDPLLHRRLLTEPAFVLCRLGHGGTPPWRRNFIKKRKGADQLLLISVGCLCRTSGRGRLRRTLLHRPGRAGLAALRSGWRGRCGRRGNSVDCRGIRARRRRPQRLGEDRRIDDAHIELEAGRRQQLCNRSLQRQSRLHRVGAGCYPESVAPKM
jgi:hypothetical protein